MKRISPVLLVAVLVFTFTASLFGQTSSPREAKLTAMKTLAPMAGKWTGSGWIMMGPNDKREFTQSESIDSKLGGLLLTIDGLGRGKDGNVVHEAFAVISYDSEKKGYRFSAYTREGRNIDADAQVSPGQLVWGFDAPYGTIRYTIAFTESGEWTEIGERSADNKTWTKFFEMKLMKEK